VQDGDVLCLAREIFTSIGISSARVTIQICRDEGDD
jgi:hypothetical protein